MLHRTTRFFLKADWDTWIHTTRLEHTLRTLLATRMSSLVLLQGKDEQVEQVSRYEAAFLKMARAAAMMSLRGVFFVQPLVADLAGQHVECAVGDEHFEVRSGTFADDGSLDEATIHCTGRTSLDDPVAEWASLERALWERVAHARSCALAALIGALYPDFHTVGLQYGPGYRTLVQAWGGASDAAGGSAASVGASAATISLDRRIV
mgnify:CR=1 FL=1